MSTYKTGAHAHAERRLKEAVKYVSRHWGNGFNIIGDSQRQALVRAEMLADIHRIDGMGEADTYRELVEAMAAAAMAWEWEPR